MSASSGRVQLQSEQHVTNEAANKKRAKSIESGTRNQAALPVVIAVVGVWAVVHWWRKHKRGSKAGDKPSKFSFPKAARASPTASSSLPRNKISNNKKNKDRKREERERRADRNAGAGAGAPASDKQDKEGGTIILTSRHVDMAPGMAANAPRVQRRGVPGQSSDEARLLEDLANKAAGR